MKAKKRVVIFLATVICVLALSISLTACFGSSSTVEKDPNAYYQDSRVKLTDVTPNVEYTKSLNWWTVTITGIAENISGKDYTSASLYFSIYDADSNKLGNATAYLSGFSKGMKWNFSATYFTSQAEPVKYGFYQFTAF